MTYFMGDVGRDVLWPTFGGIEADRANGVAILSLEHVHDDCFEIGAINAGFAVRLTVAAEVIDDDVDVLIVDIRHDRGCPAGPTHHKLHATVRRLKAAAGDSFRPGGTWRGVAEFLSMAAAMRLNEEDHDAVHMPIGDNARKGAVKKRTQLATVLQGKKTWTKRHKATGEFMDQKKAPAKNEVQG
jgi:hypothetical protein